MVKSRAIQGLHTIQGYWSERPWVDYIVVVLLVGAHLGWVLSTGHADVLLWVDGDQRQELYAAGAGVVAVIGGLGSIALSVYQALEGVRADAVKRLYATELRRNWLAVTTTTGAAALGCIVALAIDRDAVAPDEPVDPLFARFVFEAAIALAAARFIRLLWLFTGMLLIEEADGADSPKPEPSGVADVWLERADEARAQGERGEGPPGNLETGEASSP